MALPQEERRAVHGRRDADRIPTCHVSIDACARLAQRAHQQRLQLLRPLCQRGCVRRVLTQHLAKLLLRDRQLAGGGLRLGLGPYPRGVLLCEQAAGPAGSWANKNSR